MRGLYASSNKHGHFWAVAEYGEGLNFIVTNFLK